MLVAFYCIDVSLLSQDLFEFSICIIPTISASPTRVNAIDDTGNFPEIFWNISLFVLKKRIDKTFHNTWCVIYSHVAY